MLLHTWVNKNIYITYAEYDYLITDKYADYIIDEYGQRLKWTEKGWKFIIDLLLEKEYLAREVMYITMKNS